MVGIIFYNPKKRLHWLFHRFSWLADKTHELYGYREPRFEFSRNGEAASDNSFLVDAHGNPVGGRNIEMSVVYTVGAVSAKANWSFDFIIKYHDVYKVDKEYRINQDASLST